MCVFLVEKECGSYLRNRIIAAEIWYDYSRSHFLSSQIIGKEARSRVFQSALINPFPGRSLVLASAKCQLQARPD